MNVKKWLLLLAAIWIAQCGGFGRADAADVLQRGDWAKYFAAYDRGTFVLYDETADRYEIYNEAQSEKRLSPCSTFKIFNALAGLETGVLDRKDSRTLYRWDGTERALPVWNRDHTLKSAIQNSAVWYFQKLAANIGAERMQAYLDRIGYGNRDISGGLTTFWLGSSLKISAREQTDLLRALYAGKLPVAKENAEIVIRDITLDEQDGLRFMGKTGSASGDRLGWFVGALETRGNRYIFAANIEAAGGASGLAARELVKEILRGEKLMD